MLVAAALLSALGFGLGLCSFFFLLFVAHLAVLHHGGTWAAGTSGADLSMVALLCLWAETAHALRIGRRERPRQPSRTALRGAWSGLALSMGYCALGLPGGGASVPLMAVAGGALGGLLEGDGPAATLLAVMASHNRRARFLRAGLGALTLSLLLLHYTRPV